jgi:hypothetical protein
MSVRALRITGLKSAGNFTRDECHDLNAEKIQRVKCFMFTRCGICCCQQFPNAGAAGRVRKFQVVVNWRKWRFASPCPVYPGGVVALNVSAVARRGHGLGGMSIWRSSGQFMQDARNE